MSNVDMVRRNKIFLRTRVAWIVNSFVGFTTDVCGNEPSTQSTLNGEQAVVGEL
jgi:hypothetical protein